MRVPWDVAWGRGTGGADGPGGACPHGSFPVGATNPASWGRLDAGGFPSGVYTIFNTISNGFNPGFTGPNAPVPHSGAGRRCPDVLRGCHAGRDARRAIHSPPPLRLR